MLHTVRPYIAVRWVHNGSSAGVILCARCGDHLWTRCRAGYRHPTHAEARATLVETRALRAA